MNTVNLQFIPKVYPYADEGPYDLSTQWGQIILSIRDTNENTIQNIMDWEWDIRSLLEWLIDFKHIILSEKLPDILERSTSGSIAEKIDIFYDSVEEFPDKIYGQLRDYTARHDYTYGLPGIDVTNALFGLNAGVLEVSHKSSTANWKYPVNLDSLFSQAEQLVQRLNVKFDADKMYII